MAKVKLPIYQRTQLVGGDYGTGDIYWDNVSLLMLFTKEDRFGVVDDLSTNSHTGTFENSATIDTAVSKFPGSRFGPSYSAVFDGTNYISISDDPSFSFGSGDFTIELHVRFNGAPDTSGHTLIAKWTDIDEREWFFGYRTSGNLEFVHSVNAVNGIISISEPWSPSGDVWYHVACCRQGSNLRLFIDGVQFGDTDTTIGSDVIADTVSPVYIGAFANDGTPFQEFLDGWVDNVRITKGVARYTEDFTPPKAPYANYEKRGPATSIFNYPIVDPLYSDTAALFNFEAESDGDTTVTDLSAASQGTLSTSNVTVSNADAKFGSNSLTGDIGTAANGIILPSPTPSDFDLTANNFTIEWFAKASSRGFGGVYFVNTLRFYFNLTSTQYLGYNQFGLNQNRVDNYSGSYSTGVWHHLTIMGDGSRVRAYVNGTLETNRPYPSGGFNWDDTETYYLCSGPINGYFDDVRYTKSLRYDTAGFTPPDTTFGTQ